MHAFIDGIPKAELHVHLEGTLEPELKFALADRNCLELPYASVEEMRSSYDFDDLPSFLAQYYEGMSVLIGEEDFYDHHDGLLHTGCGAKRCVRRNVL